jgi:hypothetical protein
MSDYYKRFVFNPDQFRDMPIMTIIELLQNLDEKINSGIIPKGQQYSLDNQEMDFWVHFDNLLTEYNYMRDELKWEMNRIKPRLEIVKKMIFAGEKYRPIWIKEQTQKSDEKMNKNKSLVQDCLKDWQDKKQAVLPIGLDYFND